jgi:hypothetical protein
LSRSTRRSLLSSRSSSHWIGSGDDDTDAATIRSFSKLWWIIGCGGGDGLGHWDLGTEPMLSRYSPASPPNFLAGQIAAAPLSTPRRPQCHASTLTFSSEASLSIIRDPSSPVSLTTSHITRKDELRTRQPAAYAARPRQQDHLRSPEMGRD